MAPSHGITAEKHRSRPRDAARFRLAGRGRRSRQHVAYGGASDRAVAEHSPAVALQAPVLRLGHRRHVDGGPHRTGADVRPGALRVREADRGRLGLVARGDIAGVHARDAGRVFGVLDRGSEDRPLRRKGRRRVGGRGRDRVAGRAGPDARGMAVLVALRPRADGGVVGHQPRYDRGGGQLVRAQARARRRAVGDWAAGRTGAVPAVHHADHHHAELAPCLRDARSYRLRLHRRSGVGVPAASARRPRPAA